MTAFDKAWRVVKSDSDRERADGPIALCDDADRYLEAHPSQDVEPDFNCGMCDFCFTTHGRIEKKAGTSECPCRQGYNPCDDPKCNEWHNKSR